MAVLSLLVLASIACAQTANLFPPGSVVGYPGPTPTGIEAFEVATGPAAPAQTNYFPLVRFRPSDEGANGTYDPFAVSFGNLSPALSLPPATFSPDFVNSSALIPPQCTLNQVHLLHRHGSRYPTSGSAPASFGVKVANNTGKFNASGSLSFLNKWQYGLGAEILTPFGREQLFELGVSFRVKYGYLLDKFANGTLPVFRTTSEDRMLKSALNFAAGFFGIPYEDQYHQSILIEATGFNNTLAPYETCTNGNNANSAGGSAAVNLWVPIYLKDAAARLTAQSGGLNITASDAYAMQQLCAYEVNALGYSDFCPLFTQEEFKGFEYTFDLSFWYSNFFGGPYVAAQGIGYVQELVARLTQTPVAVHNSTTNSTLDNSAVTFPLNQPIYVDASHDTVISAIIVAMNFSSLAATGPLPTDHIPAKRSFIVSQVAPFATQLAGQVLTCTEGNSTESYIRWLLNDASLPLTNIPGCAADPYGRCLTSTWLAAMKQRIQQVSFANDCLANYTIANVIGANITDGRPPKSAVFH
ncbi:phosphoglycerate mutase-like protein [Dacryopinax primogenitus]|uniref:Phosphoglycerate mutase-like protein n=1 Tax=Dacryopinax primogenitus (strain DJM 731) TaxID=1858805 RepID=M5G4S9_DACPD|nr:phosphoglycerate mutase-like protein [Dacryopinax primogenitus]EJU00867.1 phosphoglycerate mutase-like protein [Dacryopinax primogenitus]